jgi:uncharacterized membrane protein YfcA
VTEESNSPRFYALIAVGVIGGLLAGLFGVGGGIIMVPLLLWWARINQRRAQATSLLAIAPAALIGTASYATGGVFPVVPGLVVALGAVAGAQVGASLLRRLSLGWLRWTFIVFVAAMAATVMTTVPDREIHVDISVETVVTLLLIGIVMGVAAGLFGIGGGIIAIPLLQLTLGIGDLEAKGVSLVAMAPTALSGSFSHLRHRTARARDGMWVALGALVATPIGSLGAFALPENYANVVFGAFAMAIALALTIRAFRARGN